MYNMSPFASRNAAAAPPEERLSIAQSLPFLRKVYTLFSLGILLAVGGALTALYAGDAVPVDVGGGQSIGLAPLLAFGLQHWIVMTVVYFAAFLAATFARRVRGLNVAALLGYTFVTGLYLAPTLFLAQLYASSGSTLDPSPVRDAFLLTLGAFTGLSGYVLISRKDFSFLAAALSMGLWVVLGAMLLGFFFHAAAFQLAIASVGVLLFCGYILYDTSRILKLGGRAVTGDAVGAALSLFLDVVNLFMFLLRILSNSRSR